MTSTGDSSLEDDVENGLQLEVTRSSQSEESAEDVNESHHESDTDITNTEEDEDIEIEQIKLEKASIKPMRKPQTAPKINQATAMMEKMALPTTSSAANGFGSSSTLKTKGKSLAKPKSVITKTKMPKESKSGLTTKNMIIQAVADLNNKKGSNIAAIKKHMIDKYDISQQRVKMITKLLRTADEEGWLIQTAGTGASSGSYFKLTPEVKKDIQNLEKKKQASIRNAEKLQIKSKEATKRKTEKKVSDKESLTKKKKSDEAAMKVATTKKKKLDSLR